MLGSTHHNTDYHAKRVSVDDPGKKYVRLDIETVGGTLNIDDISVDRILLSTALQKISSKCSMKSWANCAMTKAIKCKPMR